MLGNYRVAAQLVAPRVVLSSTELVSYNFLQVWTFHCGKCRRVDDGKAKSHRVAEFALNCVGSVAAARRAVTFDEITAHQQRIVTAVECRCKRLSSSSVVRHVLTASWEESESRYPEDGGYVVLRNADY
jgi:hypothetical protein